MNMKDIGRGRLRQFRVFVLAAVLALTLVTGSGLSAKALTNWVWAGIPSGLTATYGSFHYNNIPNLPAKFEDYGRTQSNQCYYSLNDGHTIYCTEIERHYYYNAPDESTTPPANFTDATKQKLVTYVLANGQKFYEATEEGIKRQTATQLAVWLISEELQNNDQVLDAVLFPVSGGVPNDAAFAPTPEVGRIARTLLEGAKAFVASGADISTLLGGGPIPSFMSTDEASAQVFPMSRRLNDYAVELSDKNGTIGRDWPNYLKLTDSAGLNVLAYADNTMTVAGNPQAQTTTIKFEGPYGGYNVSYLSTTEKVQATGEDFQQMIRLARLNGSIPLFFKVSIGDAPLATANLNLSKTVVNGDTNKQFSFAVNFKTASGTDVTGVLMNGTAFKNGDPLTLKHGTTASFTNIPLGTVYTIVEASYAAERYTSDKLNNSASGTLSTAAAISVNYTNTYTAPGQPNNPKPAVPTSRSPKTGDPFPAAIWVGLILAAVALIVGACVYWWKIRKRL